MLKEFEMKLTQKLAEEYKRSIKSERSNILDEYCKLTDVTRNTASKRFKKIIQNPYPIALKINKNRKKKHGRKPKYTFVHKRILKKCFDLTLEACAERIHPMLPVYVDQLIRNGKLPNVKQGDIETAMCVSLGTLKNIVKQFPKTSNNRYKNRNPILAQIPIQANFAQFAHKVGYIGVDYVEHSGGNASGRFGITGTYTDIAIQWTVRSAALGKNQESVEQIYDSAVTRIPHTIIEIHIDNAKASLKILFEKSQGTCKGNQSFRLSRSRPYKKEDNAHVEQKNGDKVRKEVGYLRYDTEKEIQLLNQYYEISDVFNNFFIASSKLIKVKKDALGRTIGKVHDIPQTPYQRLVESKDIPKSVKQDTTICYKNLNMVSLRKEMDQKLKQLYKAYSNKFQGI
jgi:hypothetical protein